MFETNVMSKLEDIDQIVAARSTIDTRSHNKIVEWQLAQCIATEAASNAHADRPLQMHHIKRLNVAKPLITKMVQDIVDSSVGTICRMQSTCTLLCHVSPQPFVALRAWSNPDPIGKMATAG